MSEAFGAWTLERDCEWRLHYKSPGRVQTLILLVTNDYAGKLLGLGGDEEAMGHEQAQHEGIRQVEETYLKGPHQDDSLTSKSGTCWLDKWEQNSPKQSWYEWSEREEQV